MLQETKDVWMRTVWMTRRNEERVSLPAVGVLWVC